MKIYKVDKDGELVSSIQLLRKLAQDNSIKPTDEFEVFVDVTLCYKMNEDGSKLEYKPNITITDDNGNTTGTGEITSQHFGFGEEELLERLFKVGTGGGSVYAKIEKGFAESPDLFYRKGKRPPEDPDKPGVLSPSTKQRLEEDKKKGNPLIVNKKPVSPFVKR